MYSKVVLAGRVSPPSLQRSPLSHEGVPSPVPHKVEWCLPFYWIKHILDAWICKALAPGFKIDFQSVHLECVLASNLGLTPQGLADLWLVVDQQVIVLVPLAE